MSDDLAKRLDNLWSMLEEEGFYTKANTVTLAKSHIEELEAKLAKAVAGLKQCEEEIDQYIWQEYPSDHPVHERYRKRDFSANPARLALAALSSVSCANLKGQDDE